MHSVDTDTAIGRLMRFLAVEGVTGQEAAIGRELMAALKEAGVPARAMRLDDANTRIPLPTETGNLIVDLPGRGALGNADRLLFMTHMDTVPLCAGAKPKRQGRKIVNQAKTALGGDNRTGCAVLVTLAAELARQKLDHPPLTLMFCVREESGLWGARFVDTQDLGPVKMAFNYDGRSASDVVIGAVGADRWEAEIFGRASHAGGAPERGISSTMILALALADVQAGGWFGKVVKGGKQGTSNVGPVTGGPGRPAGDATNVVTDYVHVRGESRSHDPRFFKEITAAYKAAFTSAAASVTNSDGKAGRVKFSVQTDYHPFRLKESLPVVKRAIAAVEACGTKPNVRATNGGLDANWMVRHAIPTVTFGAGQNEAHTIDEWVNLDEFEGACRLAVELATMRVGGLELGDWAYYLARDRRAHFRPSGLRRGNRLLAGSTGGIPGRIRDTPTKEPYLMGPSYLSFWGKADGERAGEPAWHPAAYHCLDVAAVAETLLAVNPRKLHHLARLLGTPPENARRVIVCLVALHDVGKFASSFQKKCPAAWPTRVLGDARADRNNDGGRHDHIGFDLRGKLAFTSVMHPAFSAPWLPEEIGALWGAVAGHHGKPMPAGGSIDIPTGMSTAGIEASCAFARDVAALFGPFEALAEPTPDNLAALSWIVAGLTVIADWIGSNRDRFPYRAPDPPLAAYWIEAKRLANTAVKLSGVLPSPIADKPSAAKNFPSIVELSPLQAHVQNAPLPDGPALVIIEDVTGSGKTEAALLLAARWLAQGSADGLFFALPTMATANAMFVRLSTAYRRLFADDALPSLVLAHGRAALHEGFTASILVGGSPRPERETEAVGDGSSAACAAWIADDRRKAFLAHVGVGTIDQALLGVLPSRHQALRLWGLADRILIVDEAHAYDAYMSRELERLMQFHAALGGSAIVLSATLPSGQRKALSQAFAKGMASTAQLPANNDYPLVTTVSGRGVSAQPLDTCPDRVRKLVATRIETASEAVSRVTAMARSGAAVAWIRNSVDDAIEAVELLRTGGLAPVLLHARFAMGDRLDIEARVCKTLGKPGPGDDAERRGFVVVGTQILEQSLDYDVDGMVTDLAPIDLMIQRAGRLWRHTDRTGRPVEGPELLVLSPDPGVVTDRDWYRQLSSRAAAVYYHHGIVWRSAKVLFEAGAIETPGTAGTLAGVRGLVEAVYGRGDLDDIPAPLLEASQIADGKRSAERSIAGANLLKVEKGYAGQDPTIWTSDTITPTRLGDPVVVFRLGRLERDRVVPWYPARDGDLGRAWALSEVSLNRRKAVGIPEPDDDLARRIEIAKSRWPEWEREQPLLVLEPDGEVWRGAVIDKAGVTQAIAYDEAIGLRITA